MNRPFEYRNGGLALITKKECKAKSVQGDITETFEYGLWDLTFGKSNIMLLGIYHPPPSNRYLHTNETFIDKFLEMFMDISKKKKWTFWSWGILIFIIIVMMTYEVNIFRTQWKQWA